MILLKGAEVSSKIKAEVLAAVSAMEGHVPTAAIVRVGERPDDVSYEKNAMKKIAAFGMEARSYVFPEDISQQEFEEKFRAINQDPQIDGILLFRPLPPQMKDAEVRAALAPEKDVDGITDSSLAAVFTGAGTGYAPCTAAACVEILDYYGIPLEGRRVTVVGRSLVVGKPAAMLLDRRNATVTICHSRTKDLPAVCREADILVVAMGRRGAIGADCVRPGQVVVDVGIHADEEGKLCGDVRFAEAEPAAGAITPVPGGVGTVTTSVLVEHVVAAAEAIGRQKSDF